VDGGNDASRALLWMMPRQYIGSFRGSVRIRIPSRTSRKGAPPERLFRIFELFLEEFVTDPRTDYPDLLRFTPSRPTNAVLLRSGSTTTGIPFIVIILIIQHISIMVKPIPDNVKGILNELPPAQQVILRSYIASLRSDLVALEEQRTTAEDSHAHYHGHELCTADHGHGEHEKDHDHEHKHTEHCDHKEDHDHKHHDHAEDHAHTHTEHCEHEHKDHKHDHHEHKHHHDDEAPAAKEEEDLPAWKKAALSSDPSAAPFGGNWHSESNVSAADSAKSNPDSMHE
jgi:hypothetical protein